MIISSPMASDSAVDRPRTIPPRTLFESAMLEMLSASSASCQPWWSIRSGVNMPLFEPADGIPPVEDHQGTKAEPAEQGNEFPVAPEPVERPSFEIPRLAFRHFSGCSRRTSNGKQPQHGNEIKLS